MSIYEDLKKKNSQPNSESNRYIPHHMDISSLEKSEKYRQFEKRIRGCIDPRQNIGLFTIDELCDYAINIGRQRASEECLNSIRIVINAIKNDNNMMAAFSNYIFWVVASDGKLTREEFEVTKPILSQLFASPNVSYTGARDHISYILTGDAGIELSELFEGIMSGTMFLLDSVNEYIGREILATGLFLSACDGKIDDMERDFLKLVFMEDQ